MIFIAKCNIEEHPYMNDSRRYTKTHLVEADDESSAIKKIERFYHLKNDAYCIAYSVDVVDIDEMITDETIS